MKFRFLWFVVAVAIMWAIGVASSYADMTWDTPIGTIGIPLQSTELVTGYDGILKQAIAGASVPVYQDPKGIVALQIGAVAPWPTNGNAVQPYFALGHDFIKEIPLLAQFKTIHLNAFGRYDSTQGKAGAGISASWSFAQ